MNLSEYIEQSKRDQNLFYKLQPGVIQNLLEEAIEIYENHEVLKSLIDAMPKIECQECGRLLNAHENIFEQIIPGPPPKIRITLHCECEHKLIKEFLVSTMMQENKINENDLPFLGE